MKKFEEVALPDGYKARGNKVCGVGINDAWYVTERNLPSGKREKCPFSVRWKSIINTSKKKADKTGKCIEEFIDPDWLVFSKFREWMEAQDWEGNQIILSSGDRYCPSGCTFIPKRLGGLTYGIGFNEGGDYPSYIGGKVTKERTLWDGMLRRCYSGSTRDRDSTYQDCTVEGSFLNYQKFAEWCNNQIGFGNEGWCLDKDILNKGNKVYSENTCVFLPNEINTLFNKKKKQRGELPIGVSKSRYAGKFYSCCNKYGVQKPLGDFETVEGAFSAYKACKEEYIKEVANKWKDQIDPRAYQAMMRYEVEIDD